MMGFFCNHIQHGKSLMEYHDNDSEKNIYINLFIMIFLFLSRKLNTNRRSDGHG